LHVECWLIGGFEGEVVEDAIGVDLGGEREYNIGNIWRYRKQSHCLKIQDTINEIRRKQEAVHSMGPTRGYLHSFGLEIQAHAPNDWRNAHLVHLHVLLFPNQGIVEKTESLANQPYAIWLSID
jgi:hypothetical protein